MAFTKSVAMGCQFGVSTGLTDVSGREMCLAKERDPKLLSLNPTRKTTNSISLNPKPFNRHASLVQGVLGLQLDRAKL